MTGEHGKPLPSRATVRTVPTVRQGPPMAANNTDGSPAATVRQPSEQARQQAGNGHRFAPVRCGRFGRSFTRPRGEGAPTRPGTGIAGPSERSREDNRGGNRRAAGFFRSTPCATGKEA